MLWEQALESSQALFCSTLLVGVWVSWRHHMSALATSGFLALRLRMMPFVRSPNDEIFWQPNDEILLLRLCYSLRRRSQISRFANPWDLVPCNALS